MFPIGERLAAISVTAALFDARATFIVLLYWGGASTAYAVGARAVRALRAAGRPVLDDDGVRRLCTFRDDGLLARRIGAATPEGVPAWPLSAAAAAVVLGAAALTGAEASTTAAGGVVCAAILLGGAASRSPHDRLLDWMTPPLLRAVEFAGVTWLAVQRGSDALPAAFALLFATAIRHYNNVYRLRQRGEDDPDRIGALSLGWDGRLLLVFALVALDEVPEGLYVAAGCLAALFAGEAAHGWVAGDGEADLDADAADEADEADEELA